MYITKNHFAFYSNVFGYVTKLLIPIKSVVKISKEKTIKIIPNAIAVATADERHVFSSFLSRENAYQLMISVWEDHMLPEDIERKSSSVYLRTNSHVELATLNSTNSEKSGHANASAETASPLSGNHSHHGGHRRQGSSSYDIDISEIDDESSSAISGSEGLLRKRLLMRTPPPQIPDEENVATLKRNVQPNFESCDYDSIVPNTSATDPSADMHIEAFRSPLKMDDPMPTIVFYKFRIPQSIHIAYFGLTVAVLLALLAGFCAYQIQQLQLAQSHRRFGVNDLHGVSCLPTELAPFR